MRFLISIAIFSLGCGENYNPNEVSPVADFEAEESELAEANQGDFDQEVDSEARATESPTAEVDGESPETTPTVKSIETKYTFSGSIVTARPNGRIFGWAVLNEDPFVHVEASILVGDPNEPTAIIGPFDADRPTFDEGKTGSHGFVEKIPSDLLKQAPFDMWLIVDFDGQVYQLSTEAYRFTGK